MKKCFECGELADHEHHVIPRILGGTKTIPLCEKHHGLIHDLKMVNHRTLVSTGMLKKKASGKNYCRLAPYGFSKADDGTLVPNEREQFAINRMKQLDGLGYSTLAVAKILTAEGYTSRDGAAFSQSTIYRIVRKETQNAITT